MKTIMAFGISSEIETCEVLEELASGGFVVRVLTGVHKNKKTVVSKVFVVKEYKIKAARTNKEFIINTIAHETGLKKVSIRKEIDKIKSGSKVLIGGKLISLIS